MPSPLKSIISETLSEIQTIEKCDFLNLLSFSNNLNLWFTVKILKFGTPQTIAIIVLKIEMFAVTLH